MRLNAFHAHGVYGEAKAGRTPQEVERLADGLRARGVAKLILPALYL
ncbi:putative pyruvate formate lyase activating enzyme [Salmonella enterica subsp. enterica serovar Cerro str. FSL R8-0235]|nr:putative pyruvate formate lyase activating enzyme [Salmonella enterica subsp. enterica serovar Cerro str. FSL R8-0235]